MNENYYNAIEAALRGSIKDFQQVEEISRLRGAIKNFLCAIDSGYFGDDLNVGPPDDRVESAFVVALREVIGRAA